MIIEDPWQSGVYDFSLHCRANGEEPLPEEDTVLFKPIPEPNPLDTYLLNNQISNCCEQLNQISATALQKLHLVESLQNFHA